MRRSGIAILLVAVLGCQKAGEDKPQTKPPHELGSGKIPKQAPGMGSDGKTAQPGKPKVQQINPPLDLKTPPADATKTASGLIYKKLIVNAAGTAAKRNDTVLINYTGWRQQSGETFFSNRARGQPMPLNLASTAPGFTEAMQLLKKGEKAMLWVPPSIGYKGTPQPGAETLVYEVEIVDIMAAPEIPTDLAGAPATAQTSKGGTKYVVLRPGTGKERARNFDTVTFNYSGWDSEGRMFDSTEMRKRPATVPPYKQTAVMEDILTTMTAGQRVRFWVDAEKMTQGNRPSPNMPKGLLVYELEVLQIEKAAAAPPPTPPDVAKPPGNVQKTAKGVMYRVLKSGAGGPKPKPTEAVKVIYTGWTTDGRMFDSSVIKGQPAEFRLDGVVAGWTDGLQQMSVGDRFRFWIPEELAYKGAPNRPQGMLVFDIELVEIKEPPKAGHHDSPHAGAQPPPPAPPDVAAPPADAKKTDSGLAYKVLTAGKGGAKPGPTDKVKVHYVGWQTTGGAPFDGSYKTGKPAEFGVNRVIKGWSEGLQLMSPGDKFRFWIPEELAYPKGGGPTGMLVFDVELLEIK